MIIWDLAVADPGFLPGGVRTPKNLLFAKFCRKLYESERIWTLGGVPNAPLDSPMLCFEL